MKQSSKKEKMRTGTKPLLSDNKSKPADEATELAESIIDTVREPLLILDKDLRVVKASQSFFDYFKVSPGETIGALIYDLGNGQWDIPQLRDLLETILPEKTSFDDYEVKHIFSKIGKRVMLLNARRIERAFGKEKIILLAIEDITERKSEEEILAESNRMTSMYLDILLDRSNVPIIIWNFSFEIVRLNQAFEKLCGYNLNELKNQKLGVLFPKEKVDSTLEFIKVSIDTDDLDVIEVDILTKNKQIKTVLWNSENIYDESDAKIVATMAQDITRRKLTELQLKESEEKYRSFFENSIDSILLTIPDGRILSANPAACKMFGYSEQELIGLGKSGIVDINDPQLPILLSERELHGKVRGELKLMRKDGTRIFADISSAIFKDHNGLDRTSMIIRDITAQKHMVDELLKLSSAVEQSPASIIITDIKGNIEYVNPKVTEITGYQLSELEGMNPRIFATGEKPAHDYKVLWDTISSGKEWRGEFHNKKKNGELFWESASISAIKNNMGEIIHYLAVKEDITEQKLIEKELIEAKIRAEDSDKLKSEFLAQMSHEIRTPLGAIVGNVDYLLESHIEKMDSDTRDCFDGIELASKRIIRTVDLILNAAELQRSSYKPHFIRVNLDSEILEKLIIEHSRSAKQRGLELIYINELNNTIIFGDEYSITQIFANLIDNAIKYTNIGRVEIHLVKNDSGNIIVEVRDTGIGISKEFFPRLFEPFAQEEQGYSRSFDGNGLGLALAKKYCDINNAVIEVQSEKKMGTIFKVIFDKKVQDELN